MIKKLNWRLIFISTAWITSTVTLLVLMSFVSSKKAQVVCKELRIFIKGTQYFIDKQEVGNILSANNNTIIGSRMEAINLQDLENRLKANPFIEYAKVYADMDGTVFVDVSQRLPVLRIMNHFNQDFYVDQHGLKIPLSNNFTAMVLVANGDIDEMLTTKLDTLHTDLAKGLLKTAQFIRKDSLWNAQIAQIFVNNKREIELIPRVGNNRILLGEADSLTTKFNNLYIFYKNVIQRVGWDTYKTINLKYANQVVGVKSDNRKGDTSKVKLAVADSIKLNSKKALIKK
jgi:cell division protein FtsQ